MSGAQVVPTSAAATVAIPKAEKLVSLAKHDYSLEPNVTFTPNGRWVVFRSNILGPTHVFAVEVNKHKP